MFLQPGAGGINLGSVQLAQGSSVQTGGTLSMQGAVVPAGSLQSGLQSTHTGTQQHTVTQHSQQAPPPQQQQNLIRDQSATLTQVDMYTHQSTETRIYNIWMNLTMKK